MLEAPRARGRGSSVQTGILEDNPNGGYLLSLITSALTKELEHPDPISITTHYLRPGIPNVEFRIEINLVRTGRTLSNVRATLSQEGKPRLEVMAVYGDLSQSVGIETEIPVAPPIITPENLCVDRTGDMQGIELPIMNRLDVRLDPTQTAAAQGDEPIISGWIRFSDEREPDARSLLLFCDAFPPSPFGYLGNVGWVPTVELTVHVRQRPAPGWILGQFKTDHLAAGRMVESGTLWDSSGKLVAQSRQLGLILKN